MLVLLALGLAVPYLILRGTAWRPGGGDPVRAVRVHAMITALIALFASGTSGYYRLSQPETGEPLPWAEALVTVCGPVVGLALVYVVAQYTWPRQTGPVRTARLADRRTTQYLPRALCLVAGIVMLLAGAAVALAWTTPQVEVAPGSRAGAVFAPWLLGALGLIVLGFAAVLRVVARRPPLGGLHPHDDHLVRQITVNRALRTVIMMLWGVANAAVQAWAQAHRALALDAFDPLSEAAPPVPALVELVESAVGITGAALLLAMLPWRSPALRQLGEHTVTERMPVPPRPPADRPGTVGAAGRLRRESITLASLAGVIAALVTAGPMLGGTVTGFPAWAAVPFAAVLMSLGLYEFAIRRGHCPSPRVSPSVSGTAPRWAWRALGAALVLAAAWCVLSLTTAVPQTGPATVLGASTGVMALGSIVLTRLALRRPPLGRAAAADDQAIRSAGAERILAVGAAGITAATAMACFVTVQVWHGFLSDTQLALGVNELPDSLLTVRLVVVFALAGLAVVFLLGPGAWATSAETAEPVQFPVHR
ncbi:MULTISPECIES: hypothetical protein [Citricoccus]|uniref:hypothetical protein n=1 Tax=Citricoccus TaxID=169133 RepID=UPI000255F176|nr:hypothetical protein [Citricoccus sp. CH26A]